MGDDFEQALWDADWSRDMSSAFTASSNASIPVCSALSITTSSAGRSVVTSMPIRVMGSSPNSGSVIDVTGKCSSSRMCVGPG